MTTAPRTPEELDGLLEDAFVLRDRDSCRALFADGAVLEQAGRPAARGGEAIARAITELWAGDRTYVSAPRRVLQAGDTALVVSDAAIHVARRAGDRRWRVEISLLELDESTRSEDP